MLTTILYNTLTTGGLSNISLLGGGGSVYGKLLYADDVGGVNWADVKVFSLGGGTGTATGSEVSESLFTNKTFIGPESLFKCIWYFLLKTCQNM